MSSPDWDEIRAELKLRCEEIAEELLGLSPSKGSSRRELRFGSKGSFALSLAHDKRGLWYDHETGESGDIPALIRRQRSAPDWPAVFDWARQRLSMPAPASRWVPRSDYVQHNAPIDLDKIAYAQKLASEASPVAGTLGEVYLTQTRGITPPASGWPVSVLFHAGKRALLVAGTTAAGTIHAVQLIYLTDGGRKRVLEDKNSAKISHGPQAGTAVRLPGDDSHTVLAEGPETGLSVWAATGCTVLIALGSVTSIDPPPGRITVAGDDDPVNPKLDARLKTVLRRWRQDGRRVSIVFPWAKRRYDKSDFNDLLLAAGPAAVRSRICPPPPGSLPRGLGPYYAPPTMGKAETLAAQATLIRTTITAGAMRAAITSAIRARTDADCPPDPERDPKERARIQRLNRRAVLADYGLSEMPPVAQALATGSQGTGKTHVTLDTIAEIKTQTTIWFIEPDIAKCREIEADYNSRAHTLPMRVFLGRSQLDAAGDRMCARYKIAARVAAAGISVPQNICPKCSFRNSCSYLKQEAAVEKFAETGGIIALPRQHAFLKTRIPSPDIMILDESIVDVASDNPLAIITTPDPVPTESLIAGLDLETSPQYAANQTLNRLFSAIRLRDPLDAIRADPLLSPTLLGQALETMEYDHDTYGAWVLGSMDDDEIEQRLDSNLWRDLPNTIAFLQSVLRELRRKRSTFNGITVSPTGEVRVHRLKSIREAPAMLLLDGTGSIDLVRRILPRVVHHHFPVDRETAYVIGTPGRQEGKPGLGYSRQSFTGVTSKSDAIDALTSSSAQLRADVITIATREGPNTLICGSLKVIDALPATGHPRAHFGALKGRNMWENCPTVILLGREMASAEALEDKARPLMVDDDQPLIPLPTLTAAEQAEWRWTGWPCRQTRMRRMRDGSLQPVEVDVHPDPRVQAVMEQMREAECVQAVDRVRPHRHEGRRLILLNALVLDIVYDEIMRHDDVVAGGALFDRCMAEKGFCLISPTLMYQQFPQFFASFRTARRIVPEMITPGGQTPIIYANWALAPRCIYCRFKLIGEGQKWVDAWVDLGWNENIRLTLELALGPLAGFSQYGRDGAPLPSDDPYGADWEGPPPVDWWTNYDPGEPDETDLKYGG